MYSDEADMSHFDLNVGCICTKLSYIIHTSFIHHSYIIHTSFIHLLLINACNVGRWDFIAIHFGISGSKFCTKKQNHRGIRDPQQH